MGTDVDNPELTSNPEEQTALYVAAFNSGDADAVNRLYTDDAVSIWEPGNPLTGQARKDELAAFLEQRPSMSAEVRHSYVTGDTTLLVVDWTMDVAGSDGKTERLQGTGLDVLRRGADGKWRYAIDNPFGEDS